MLYDLLFIVLYGRDLSRYTTSFHFIELIQCLVFHFSAVAFYLVHLLIEILKKKNEILNAFDDRHK